MNISVVGAGGGGGYFGAVLARAGNEVRLLARGDHLEAIRAGGLKVHDPDGEWTAPVAAAENVEGLLPAELAIVAVKSYSLSEVTPDVRRLAEAGAVILPLLNGVETYESLVGQGVAAGSILCGLTVISVEKSAPGVVTRHSEFRSIVVGEHDGVASERVDRIAGVLRETGTDVRVSEDIVVDLWRKWLVLATMATACGLARSPIGAVRDAPLGWELLERAAAEIAAVARARGVDLPAGEETLVRQRIGALPPHMKPSFLLDLERGGPNELDVLSGAVSRFGRACGVSTPVHDTATAAFSAAARRQPPG
jgi:2-dehydropantoate 2-reductase